MNILASAFRWLVVATVQRAYLFVRNHPVVVLLLLLLAVISAAVWQTYAWAAQASGIFSRVLGWFTGKDAQGRPLQGKDAIVRRALVAVALVVIPGTIWVWLAAKVWGWAVDLFAKPITSVEIVPVGEGALN